MGSEAWTGLPEQGQLADVRCRRYVVTEVSASSLPADPLSPIKQAHHLVTLASMEDDALCEELRVIWELEPGTQVCEDGQLPASHGFDEPRRLDAFLNIVRWGAVSSAHLRVLQAPFRSGFDIEDYQLDPVVGAIQMPRVTLLIADDVGLLGKTIEAGLVAQELLLRHCARRILIVCQAALQIQWRDQTRDKFGLEFRIVDSDLMKELGCSRGIHVNPWTHSPRLITSIDFLKRDHPLRLFREVLPAEARRLSFRALDIEQIGHVYEGLLDHTAMPTEGRCSAWPARATGSPKSLSPCWSWSGPRSRRLGWNTCAERRAAPPAPCAAPWPKGRNRTAPLACAPPAAMTTPSTAASSPSPG